MVTERKEIVPAEEGEEVSRQGVEDIDPSLIQQLVSLADNEVIVPLRMKREDVHRMKAVKLSDEEVVSLSKFQVYLFDRNYLRDNTFASLFCYLYNLAFTMHKQLADAEARKEELIQ